MFGNIPSNRVNALFSFIHLVGTAKLLFHIRPLMFVKMFADLIKKAVYGIFMYHLRNYTSFIQKRNNSTVFYRLINRINRKDNPPKLGSRAFFFLHQRRSGHG
ncbi:hypothetical protein Barb7_01905 [Bacteroidales bacterium Barb7]|nr:hypothetical protein Barb7_01905 [Bacteroidales bacterium Barb7]